MTGLLDQTKVDVMSKGGSAADNLNAISIFVAVGSSVSFTSAAQKLQISVSGVSKAVSRLEASLGTRLIHRTPRRITLTDEGAIYFARCQQILHDLNEAEAMITEARILPRGRLRVQAPRGLGKKIIVPALAAFVDRYPEISLDLVLDANSLNLEEEAIDIALRFGRPADSWLIAKRLCRVHYVVCAAPDYIRRYGQPHTLQDLGNYRCINYIVPGTGRYRKWNFGGGGSTTSLDISGAINLIDMDAVASAAVAGAGLAYLPDFMVADHLDAGALTLVLPDQIYVGEFIYMVYPSRRHTSPRLQVFCAFLRDLLSPQPWWHARMPAGACTAGDLGLTRRRR